MSPKTQTLSSMALYRNCLLTPALHGGKVVSDGNGENRLLCIRLQQSPCSARVKFIKFPWEPSNLKELICYFIEPYLIQKCIQKY